MLSSCTCDVFQ